VLEEMGLHVLVADNWLDGQGNYLWTDPHTGVGSYDGHPWAYMVHHSASASATMPPHDTSKANAWIGLFRDGRLYQYGDGVPTVYLASAGPARISSGYGYKPAAWDYTFQQRRAPARAEGADDGVALNRYAFNVETVCEGRGSRLDGGVWESVVGVGLALENLFGLREMALGHASWTRRKVDPEWTVGLPHDGRGAIIDVQNGIAGGHNVGVAPNIDECESWEVEAWQKAYDYEASLINDNTHPQEVMTKGNYFVFQDRVGAFDSES
jgi:hypothetical protein